MICSYRAAQLARLLDGCFDAEPRYSSAHHTAARWHARCGAMTPEQVRAWVLAAEPDRHSQGAHES